MKEKRGYVQIYTGNGKGKTTAALGLALRAAGRKMKTYIGQFMKGQDYGELHSVKLLNSLITIEQYGKDTFVHIDNPSIDDIKMAQDGFNRLKDAIFSGKYDIVIADELNTAVYFKLIDEQDVLNLIDNKPEIVELIITGRYATQELIDRADLVTEMKEIKHYFQKGIFARDGIER